MGLLDVKYSIMQIRDTHILLLSMPTHVYTTTTMTKVQYVASQIEPRSFIPRAHKLLCALVQA